MIDRLVHALAAAGETSLYQFRRVLYIAQPEAAEIDAQLATVFPNAKIQSFVRDIAELNASAPGEVCMDLILIDKVAFAQLAVLLQHYKFRYIVVADVPYHLNVADTNTRFIQADASMAVYASKTAWHDIFMPIGPSDYSIAAESVANKYRKLKGVREIFYCATEQLPIRATYVPETAYPFSRAQAIEAFGLQHDRFGWYYQQLKQLYLPLAQPFVLDNYVTMCTDVFFNRELEFFRDGKPVYTYGHETPHLPYFQHMARMLPQLRCFDGRSAISHHAVFNRRVLQDLFWDVKQHNGKEFWEAFLSNVDPSQRLYSGAAEYETYFNFLRLKGVPISTREPDYLDMGDFKQGLAAECDYFAYHWYMRTDEFPPKAG